MTNDVTNENDFSSLEEKLWDEITKKIALKMPSQFLPLLNEQFHKDYPEGTSITTLSTESITLPKQSNRKMGKIMSDIVFLVQNKDIYHVECEINLDDEMVIRMIEYDFHTALTHQLTTGQNQTPTLHFPQSIIVYPGNKNPYRISRHASSDLPMVMNILTKYRSSRYRIFLSMRSMKTS